MVENDLHAIEEILNDTDPQKIVLLQQGNYIKSPSKTAM